MTEELTAGGAIIALITIFLKNKTAKVIGAIFLTITVILALDMLFGYTESDFDTKKRISIQEYTKMEKDSLSDSLTKVYAKNKIAEIYNSEHYSSHLSRFLLKVKNSFTQPSVNVPQTQKAEMKSIYIGRYSIINTVELFSFKFFSSAWLMIILVFFLNLFFITTSKNIFKGLFCGVFCSFILLSIALGIANLCDLIPVFYSIYLNYFINFLIGILFPYLIIDTCVTFKIQYDEFIQENRLNFPNADDYDNFFDYIKARIKEVNRKLRPH
ncbi:hypothetical protein LV89_04516 [Arcicella aurantiaca]|uniref:Uncharacterized protein n=1 Tax=Arcicella aurantiaca TaxID=591202 RepID=A0A316DGP6_9BACT|nr:hypothetical protein [Arcicella aurantiaca]PWK17065.1 hypothetical protein LV89_04516 [Arcicella aurantiaca]